MPTYIREKTVRMNGSKLRMVMLPNGSWLIIKVEKEG